MARTNYIFIDFESVQEADLDRIDKKPVNLIFVLGQSQKRLPVTLVKKLLQYASQVRLIETGTNGKNAADFVLANHIGEVKMADPQGYFHVLSKDKGFNALIEHHKANGTLACRHESFAEIPVLMNKSERVKYLTKRFRSKQVIPAKKQAAFESQIQSQFGHALSASELKETISGLVAEKAIQMTIAGGVICQV